MQQEGSHTHTVVGNGFSVFQFVVKVVSCGGTAEAREQPTAEKSGGWLRWFNYY